MYQPNFCAECGARMERDEGRLWTSGRFFCAACGKRFRRGRFFVPLVLSAVLLSVGFVAGRAGRTSPPPLVIKRGAAAGVAAPPIKFGSVTAPQPADGAAASPGASGAPEAAGAHYGADGTADERPTDPAEIVSICGARTKKGTPCSRRVRGTGRCWQHRGMPAMLPPSKLIVRE